MGVALWLAGGLRVSWSPLPIRGSCAAYLLVVAPGCDISQSRAAAAAAFGLRFGDPSEGMLIRLSWTWGYDYCCVVSLTDLAVANKVLPSALLTSTTPLGGGWRRGGLLSSEAWKVSVCTAGYTAQVLIRRITGDRRHAKCNKWLYSRG